ncbi:hypothetical protein [Plantactinospora veratri]
MSVKRLVPIVATVIVAALGAVPPAAQAGARGALLYGNFNNDGLVDSAVLGVVEPSLCSTIVSYGSAPGIYVPPVAYTYLKPGGGTVYTDCPDIGVSVNLDADPEDEIWVGWTPGPPPPANFTLVVLQPPPSPRRRATTRTSSSRSSWAAAGSATTAGTAPTP